VELARWGRGPAAKHLDAKRRDGTRLSRFRVELKDGDVVDGLLVSQDKEAVILRRQNAEDLRIPQSSIRRANFTKMSMMPEGLIEAFSPNDVTDLFAHLKTLK
jgi:putative heme-binding domain-containing protein